MTVFVSYSSRDKDAVKALTQDLHDADEQVWLDQRLAGGDAWWRAILEQIRGCDVFIFALSQNSIQSKPCQAELHYAQALGLPILPVQVGSVDSMQLNPLATVQAIDYRHPTPGTAMRLSAALHRTQAQRQPLPSPLPDEPPVPFEYLVRLYTTIAGPDQLSPRDQAALAAQLQVGLREDGDHDAARRDIVTLLMKLRDRPDVTYQTRTDVDAMLASIDAGPPIMAATTTLDPTPPAPASLDDRLSSPSAPEPVRHEPADLNLAATTGVRRGLTRRTKIALIAGAVALVVVIVAVVGISALGKHGPSESSATSSSPPTSSERSYGPQVVLPFTGLSVPAGVAVDAAGNIYVADAKNNRVLKLAAGSSSQVVLPFTGLNQPIGVAVDAAGNIYVVDANNSRVLKLPAGSTTQQELPFTGLTYPGDVAVDSAGNLYTDNGNNRVLKLAAGSNTQTVLPFTGLNVTAGVAVDSAGTLYVTDAGNNRVVKLAAGSSSQEVLPFTGLNDPAGVAVDSAGNLYVTDMQNSRVLKLAAGSTSQEVLPFTGLNNPAGVAVDAAGTLYVADLMNRRVLKLPVQ